MTAGTLRQPVTGAAAPGDGVLRAQGGAPSASDPSANGTGAGGLRAQGGALGAGGHPARSIGPKLPVGRAVTYPRSRWT